MVLQMKSSEDKMKGNIRSVFAFYGNLGKSQGEGVEKKCVTARAHDTFHAVGWAEWAIYEGKGQYRRCFGIKTLMHYQCLPFALRKFFVDTFQNQTVYFLTLYK